MEFLLPIFQLTLPGLAYVPILSSASELVLEHRLSNANNPSLRWGGGEVGRWVGREVGR